MSDALTLHHRAVSRKTKKVKPLRGKWPITQCLLQVAVLFLQISKELAKSLQNNGTTIVANEGFTQDPAVAVKILKVRFVNLYRDCMYCIVFCHYFLCDSVMCFGGKEKLYKSRHSVMSFMDLCAPFPAPRAILDSTRCFKSPHTRRKYYLALFL